MHQYLKMKKRIVAFTILELLLVITVIVILTSMLLPALQGAREFSKRIKCSGNLKQIGLALHSYVDDYNLYTPTGWNQSNWADYLLPYLGNANVILYTSTVHNTDVFYCPNADKFPIQWKLNWWTKGLTYGTFQTSTVNGIPYLAGTNWSWKITNSALKKSLSRIGYTADASNCYFRQTGGSVNPLDNVTQPLKRHMKNCNIIYLDGHVNAFTGNMVWGQPNCVQHEFEIQ